MSGQGDRDRDTRRAGSTAQGPQWHLLHSEHIAPAGALSLITPEQGTNNHSDPEWPVLPCTVLWQAKFD